MEKQSLNLIDATTVFLSGKDKDIIEVTAGVTDMPFSAEMNPEKNRNTWSTWLKSGWKNSWPGS